MIKKIAFNICICVCLVALWGCQLHQNPIHFAQDLKAVSSVVSPGEDIVLQLRLPSHITPNTQVAIYKAYHKNGPYEKQYEQPTQIDSDRVAFRLPTLKEEGGKRYFQANMITDAINAVPFVRSDIEEVLIDKPKDAYLQFIYFGTKEREQAGPIYMCVDGSRRIYVYGKYSDGVIRSLNDPALGTRFHIANPPYYGTHKSIIRAVVDVSDQGLLEAFDHGQATLIVTNGTVSNSRDINVDNCGKFR